MESVNGLYDLNGCCKSCGYHRDGHMFADENPLHRHLNPYH